MRKLQKCERQLLIAVGEGGDPPKEIRLFNLGDVKTMNGDFVFDAAGADEVLKLFASYANDLAFDYEHDTFNPLATGPRPASGWIKQGALSMREDGLWAQVEWTKRADQLIRDKEYRYFSPAFNFETDSRRIVELLPSGLVNYPATIGMTPLVAKTSANKTEPKAMAGNSIKIPFESIADANEAAQKAIATKYGDGSVVVDMTDSVVTFTMNGKTWECSYKVNDAGEVELAGDMAEVAPEPGEGDGTTPPPADPSLGPAPGAAPTGLGAAAAKQISALTANVARLTAENEKRERDGKVAAALAAKKMTPAMAKLFATKSTITLDEFLSVALPIAALSVDPTKEPAKGAGETEKRWGDFTHAELDALSKSNPEYYQQLRANKKSSETAKRSDPKRLNAR